MSGHVILYPFIFAGFSMTETHRIFNFSAGPAAMPQAVLEKAQAEMLDFGGIGMSVMEISHRSPEFEAVLNKAESGLRELLAVPHNFRILFLQGGASLQFAMVPMNFLRPDQTADYIITGFWGRKALAEAQKCGNANVIYNSHSSGYTTAPTQEELNFSPDASYVHYVANETIEGVEFKYDVDAAGTPVVCDLSSNILSRPVNFENYALIYNGAQKNIGPSGIAVVFIREDLLDRVNGDLPALLDYRHVAENASMPNTPNTWAIYMVGLVCDWLREQGGVAAMEKKNIEKAAKLYQAIDSSDGFYTGHAERSVRSIMNVTFRLATPELDELFCSEAETKGLSGLRGHRSLGGVRASIYNACPAEAVDALIEHMQDFALRKG